VVITITGANDDPFITSAENTGSVVEDEVLNASGAITFADDTIDTHTATFAASSSNTTALGSFSLDPVVEEDGTGASVAWHYQLDNAAAQSLAEGEVVSETYTVTIQDNHGSTVTQDVVITITGAGDIIQVTNTPGDEALNDISGDGRFLTFSSPGVNGQDVFWTDLVTGEVKTLDWTGDQTNPHISGDGQTVVFTNTELTTAVVVWKPATDTIITVPTTGPAFLSEISDDGNHVVVSQSGQAVTWDLSNPSAPPVVVNPAGPVLRPAISGDGTFVVYEDRSFFANPAQTEISVINVVTGETWVGGDPLLMDAQPKISADGNYVVFQTSQLNGLGADISLFDRAANTTTVIAATSGEDRLPSISGDGRFVAWSSNPDGDTDIYVWDRITDTTTHLDVPGTQRVAQISADGRYISYESNEAGGQFDIYRAPNPLHDDFIA
jgi:VCBS repeat-containing protein